MDGDNPWEEWANTAIGPNGELVSGWMLENAPYAAKVPKEHSETAWLTSRAIEYIDAQKEDQPWLCHLSYIKPHWPYLAPAPYNDMYCAADLPAVNRTNAEKESDHPLMQAWINTRICQSFSRDEIRNIVAPVYMGLIKELDDQMGRLFSYLENSGRMDDTMIVFCSDHGDNMGDHWMGEKDLFHDCSARVPLLVYDPRANADSTRGKCMEELVEGIDLPATFIEFFGGEVKPHILEGHSLQPLLHGTDTIWRGYCISEYDYATRDARIALEIDQNDARLVMVFDGRWKYIHVENMRPILFDLQSDPAEVIDLGNDPVYEEQLSRLKAMHFEWCRQHHNRTTLSADVIEKMAKGKEPPGILIAYANKEDLEAAGRSLPKHVVR
jgi:arylsulfatase A-like enzyme